ncbi:Aminopeptidase P family protein [Sphingomonas antarctica]
MALLDAIEARGFVAAGRTEREVEKDIYALAELDFGVTEHWHKRICRAGANAKCTARDNPPVLTIAADDLVYLDLGPVFENWEADVGRSYVVGDDPLKHALVADLSRGFDAMQAAYQGNQDITGAALYALATDWAEQQGWRFGGVIGGHIVGEFPHAHLPGEKDFYRINPANTGRLRDPDPLGQDRLWIGEIHLVSVDGSFGGFYERLLD